MEQKKSYILPIIMLIIFVMGYWDKIKVILAG